MDKTVSMPALMEHFAVWQKQEELPIKTWWIIQLRHHECKFTPGLFSHELRPIQFTLIVNDFAVKWENREDFDHLLHSSETKHTIVCDMDGKQHVRMHLDWNQCIQDALSKLEVTKPKQRFKGPSKSPSINCRAKIQCIKDDNSAPLTQEQIKFIQRVIGKFPFMARAVDNAPLHALNDPACQVPKGTQRTWEATQHILNHMACNPTPAIRCQAGDVILEAKSDAVFDVTPNARSRAAGCICLGSSDSTQFNAPVHILSKTGFCHFVCVHRASLSFHLRVILICFDSCRDTGKTF